MHVVPLVEQAGAQGVTVHLREDRRHISDRDVRLLRQVIQTIMNLEMAVTEEMLSIALEVNPEVVTLVPERREEVTTEGGLDVTREPELLRRGIARLQEQNIRVSLFVDPDPRQIEASQAVGADDIELHTGSYANARGSQQEAEYQRLHQAALQAHALGLQVNAGHGLNYQNTQRICQLPHVRELNIGHSIVSRAVFSGMHTAVRDMLDLIRDSVPQA
jgi:pyridoxine 5-phosphate synthase